MGGCKSKAPPVDEPQVKAKEEAPAEEPAPVMAEAPAEERAMTQLRVIFDGMDANHDKAVSKTELTDALNKDSALGDLIKEAGLNPTYDVLESLDTNHDGRVTWEEFVANLKKAAVEEVMATGNIAAAEVPADEKALVELKKIFEGIDANHDGAVSQEELSTAVQKYDGMEKLIADAGFNTQYFVFEQLDTNHDGKITWAEFETHLRAAAKETLKDDGFVTTAILIEKDVAEGAHEPKSKWCC